MLDLNYNSLLRLNDDYNKFNLEIMSYIYDFEGKLFCLLQIFNTLHILFFLRELRYVFIAYFA